MEIERKKGYAWAVSAGINAALAAISAKFFSSQLKYGLVIFFNVVMWGSYVNSMRSLSSLQATVANFATNFISSGLSGFFLFDEALPIKSSRILRSYHLNATCFFRSSFIIFVGAESPLEASAVLIVIGVVVLSKSNIEKKTHTS